ncbi:MDR family MFS transporter [Myceligenerans crystallogenes]|uniref:Major facilitator superfamily (MFS) profile domain-containing protein n=1 Tax=Myceligenerans crystallogenes TaxID=316335 RepID=A0ABP4ZUT3_9MICO
MTQETAAAGRPHVLRAISGLIVGMFVALLSSTVVSPALPRIVSDLDGDQSSFTWIVTATMLAMTVSTPIWGKLSDLLDRKLLVQISLGVFTAGSIVSGFAQDPGMLIASRAVQGIGIGGLMALVQIVVADVISPRERGRYMGVIGAVMGVGQVAGPLVGGLVTDSIGWRWTFWIFVPFAVYAIAMIQSTLKLPPRPPRPVKVDYLGGALIAGGVSAILVWVSLAGKEFAWWSGPTAAMLGGGLVLLAAAVLVELRAPEPIIPMRLFRDRTFTLAVVASIAVGIAMFGASIYLSQFMQLARGATPTEAGLMTLPMVLGQMAGGIVIGQLISRSGRWKRYLVGGSIALTVALVLMSTLHHDTAFALLAVFMFLLGLGMGTVMQNLVLVVQNQVAARDLGTASAGVTFFRTLGGTLGVSALGAMLGNRVPVLLEEGGLRAAAGAVAADPSALTPAQGAALEQLAAGSFPNMADLPERIRVIVETAYGAGIAEQFLVSVPVAVVAMVAIMFLPNARLSRQTAAQRLAEESAGTPRTPELATATSSSDGPR